MKKIPDKFFVSFKKLGSGIFELFHSIGEIVVFFLECLKFAFLEKFYTRIFLKQL